MVFSSWKGKVNYIYIFFFFLHNFGVKCIPFKLGKLKKKLFEGKKKIKLKTCTKPVNRGCKSWGTTRGTFYSMSFKFSWFSQKLYCISNCSIHLRLFVSVKFFSQVLLQKHLLPVAAKCIVNQWNDKCKYKHKWGTFGLLYLLNKRVDLSFSLYFSQTLVRNIKES